MRKAILVLGLVLFSAGAASAQDRIDRQLALARICASEADLLIALIPRDSSSRGVWVELGYALGLRAAGEPSPAVWVAGVDPLVSIFTEGADARHFSDEDALHALARRGGSPMR